MMKDRNRIFSEKEINWSLTTWEGSRREQMRRWAQLPLEDAIKALEEMEKVSDHLLPAPGKREKL